MRLRGLPRRVTRWETCFGSPREDTSPPTPPASLAARAGVHGDWTRRPAPRCPCSHAAAPSQKERVVVKVLMMAPLTRQAVWQGGGRPGGRTTNKHLPQKWRTFPFHFTWPGASPQNGRCLASPGSLNSIRGHLAVAPTRPPAANTCCCQNAGGTPSTSSRKTMPATSTMSTAQPTRPPTPQKSGCELHPQKKENAGHHHVHGAPGGRLLGKGVGWLVGWCPSSMTRPPPATATNQHGHQHTSKKRVSFLHQGRRRRRRRRPPTPPKSGLSL